MTTDAGIILGNGRATEARDNWLQHRQARIDAARAAAKAAQEAVLDEIERPSHAAPLARFAAERGPMLDRILADLDGEQAIAPAIVHGSGRRICRDGLADAIDAVEGGQAS